jgi:hypothetical protein
MTTTINASPSNGIVQTADGSGVIKLQSNGVATNALAWVNFNGVTTATIRSSYNVSSVTRNGTGDYTVNFATALSDANYAAVMSAETALGAGTFADLMGVVNGGRATGSVRVTCVNSTDGTAERDVTACMLAVFGN